MALASGAMIPLDEADWVVESAVLLNHLEDDLLQQSADSDGEAVTREVRRVVESVAPTCDDGSFADGDRVDELARRIISDNTWADAGGREKAFSRHNRALPNLMPGELEAFVETYARHYLP
ncbi:hypothetical protein B2G67_13450 [Microbacterium foliorum]|nr:hypothetical protein B2G67_13450 [Microbacterium foliorum]